MKKVLKKNEYKCVELHEDSTGLQYILKRYSGHSIDNLTSNTKYIFAALQFFHDHFSGILDCPRPYAIDLEDFHVHMEYLPNLPFAERLTFETLPLADDFFHQCYALREDFGFLRSIRDSVVMTPHISRLLEMGFPASFGLKGDLRENLCLGSKRLVLADIDSVSIEPLGLSELLLYLELYASLRSLPSLPAHLMTPPVPVAFQYLDEPEARQLLKAGQEMLQRKMQGTFLPLSIMKRLTSQFALNRTIERFYS